MCFIVLQNVVTIVYQFCLFIFGCFFFFKVKFCCYFRPQEEAPLPAFTHLMSHPSDVLDMPVDPNEPTYCLCHQVSYGEMIGCDNPDVSLCCL